MPNVGLEGAHRRTGGRDAPLEALRGLACLVVVASHLSLGFAPWLIGILPGFDAADSINGAFWFAPFNGSAAVGVFFVLSGFVLTRRAVVEDDVVPLMRGAVKRWPRLAGPVLLVVLLSWALFAFGAYGFKQVGALTHSAWLQQFAYGIPLQGFEPRFADALAQGAVLTFFRGDSTYDSSLWTMKIEFIGSFVAFGLTFAVILGRRLFPALAVALFVVGVILGARLGALYCGFFAGVGLAFLIPTGMQRMPTWIAIPMGLFALYLLGYTDGRGDYNWLAGWAKGATGAPYVYAVAAVMLIVLVESDGALRRWLSFPWATVLGRLSFPIYLLHVLVLCSLGCAAYLAAASVLPEPWPRIAGAAATSIGTLVLAIPLAAGDVWWTGLLGRSVGRLVRGGSSGLLQAGSEKPPARISG